MAKYLDLYEAMETSLYGSAARQWGIGELIVEPAEPDDVDGAEYIIKESSHGNGVERTIACANLEDVDVKLRELGLRARMDGWWPVREYGEWGDAVTDNA